MSGDKYGAANGGAGEPQYHGDNGVGSQAKEAAQKLGDQASQVGAQVKDTAQRLGDQASQVGGQVKDAAQKLGNQASDMGGQVYQQAAEAGRYATRQIEEQPMTAMMVAGGVGLLIGFLLGRTSVEQPRSWRDYARDYAGDYLPRNFR